MGSTGETRGAAGFQETRLLEMKTKVLMGSTREGVPALL